MAEFVLYNYFRSSASYRVRLAMNLKGLKYDYHAVHLLKDGGEQHKPDYLKLNPSAQVPTLVHKGHAFGQSLPILEYLEEIHPTPALFPRDPLQKARVRQICEIINCTQPFQNTSTTQYLTEILKLDHEQQMSWMRHWQTKCFDALEALFQNHPGPYTNGNELTAGDCFLVPQVFAAERFKVDLTKFTRTREINENLKKLEAVVRAHPFRQPDCPEENKIKE